METTIYTVHRKGARATRFVPDRFDWLAALLPPVWVVWHGLWITALVLVALLVAVAVLVSPFAVLPAYSGAGLIFALEGGAVIRTELWLRGWREIAVVQAQSDAGAEELWLRGEVA